MNLKRNPVKRLFRRLSTSRRTRRHALVGQGRLWQMKRQFQFEFLRQQGLAPHHRFCDIGCGSLRGGIPVIEHLDSGHYCGIDVRPEVVSEAWKELREAGLEAKQPELVWAERIGSLKLSRRFDFLWAFSVLIHMPNEVVDDTMRFVACHLARGGVFFANVNLGDRQPGHWEQFEVYWRNLGFYESIAVKHGLHAIRVGTLGELGHQSGVESQDRQVMLRFESTLSSTDSNLAPKEDNFSGG